MSLIHIVEDRDRTMTVDPDSTEHVRSWTLSFHCLSGSWQLLDLELKTYSSINIIIMSIPGTVAHIR